MNPLISVIIPVYGVEKQLSRCLDSVLEQTFKGVELVLIDDGTPDSSGELCEEYAKSNSRIVVIHQLNSGVSVARNNGVRLSIGAYISFIDSDDWISERMLEDLYGCLLKQNAQIAVCDYAIVEDNSIEIKRSINEELDCFTNRKAVHFYFDSYIDKGIAQFRSPCAKLIKRDIVIRHLFPLGREYAEDAACVYLWIWGAQKTVHISTCGYYYFQNKEGVCHKPIGEFFVGNFLTEDEWIKFFLNEHFESLYIKACKKYILEAAHACIHAGDKKSQIIFRKILRDGIKQYAKIAEINKRDDSWIYDAAYPKLMNLYWLGKSFISKIRR